ncbi:major facilitator superfamily domain-containing protein [Diaporthe amygdali]|uniref:major facilitator superfamily domain-containing protein n=1 Tax=Phomopsis amygdali TaxID=1214568 RepID=UPI0022FECCC7|nr:major facilitator superfamily domain-containing protein [Diaporthe amygdali]KAJ0118720.1 major facilitator superfamily domain-containing protein [Diaporthe amygdali]
MQLDIYWTTLLILLPTVIILTGRNFILRPFARIQSRWQKIESNEKDDDHSPQDADEAGPTSREDDLRKFHHSFLSIYLLVMSSEWLSGPYLYALLRDDRKLPESVVVGLYATAYTSAAISALGVGFLADRWMVTEWNARGLDQNGVEGGYGGLSEMFGVMTTTNCMAAIVGGLFGHCMVSAIGSKIWPFWAGIVLQGVAAVLMLKRWNENFGMKQHLSQNDQECVVTDSSGTGRLGDGRIWALTFVTCCFEGTAFLVIFLWPSVLQGAHEAASAGATSVEIPYGVIFGSFMAAMIIGAIFFSASSKSMKTQAAPVWLLLSAVTLASLSLWLLGVLEVEIPLYYAFLAFEVANGIYVPSMAYMRGLVVDSKSRAGIYGLMKIPLFVFVILALGITAEGKRFRCFVFASASMSLLLAGVALLVGFWGSLGRSDGASCGLQREVEHAGGELAGEHGVNIGEGEASLSKRLDVP